MTWIKCRDMQKEITELKEELTVFKKALAALFIDNAWISVDKKLPPNNTPIIIAEYNFKPKVRMTFVGLGERHGEHWYDANNGEPITGKDSYITHWMPLPNPPSKQPVNDTNITFATPLEIDAVWPKPQEGE